MSDMNLKVTNESKHIAKTPEIQSRFTPEKKEQLAKASKDFESLLTSMMVKSMTDTTEGMFGGSGFGGDMFDTMFESQLASFMTKGKGFGLSDQIYRKITGESIADIPKTEGLKPIKINNEIKVNEKSGIDKNLKPSIGSLNRLDRYNDIIDSASKKFGLNQNLIKSIILTESAANPKAVSKANAKGLMQLMDSTAVDMGVKNSFNPKENIFGGVKYLAKLLDDYDGNVELSLAAYNAGPGNVQKYDGIPPFKETQNYINRVLSYLDYLEG